MEEGGKQWQLAQLKKEIESIKIRNARVEADKAWETSWTRKIVILILTYLVIALFMHSAGLAQPMVNSIVPAAAFFLSTMSLTWFKNLWLRARAKK